MYKIWIFAYLQSEGSIALRDTGQQCSHLLQVVIDAEAN